MSRLRLFSPSEKSRIVLMRVAAVFFVLAGVNHFLNAGFYERIVPPGFPSPKWLVIISGVAEIAGGLGLLISRLRRLAGWGLIALLIAVFPANLYMALHPGRFGIPPWILWLRLPFQGIFVGWIWMIVRASNPTRSPCEPQSAQL